MLLRSHFILLLCLATTSLLSGQMTPSAPVENFRFPRFGDNGYTQWILQGGQGIYDNEEQIRVKDMALRVFSGDARMALEMTMDSPEATIRVKENRAFSEGSIIIKGANFLISGVGWSWNGDTKEIEVEWDVFVEFSQTLADGMIGDGTVLKEDAEKLTEIRSERLRLKTTETEYRFEFINSVEAVSGETRLKSHLLIALADAPKGKKEGAPKLDVEKSDAVRELTARGAVVIQQKGHMILADHAEFFPREQIVNLSGEPKVQTSGAYLSGDTISSQHGELSIMGSADAGRAQMIILNTGGLGIQGTSQLSSETILLADKIEMMEKPEGNAFIFSGDVEVMSGALLMESERLSVFSSEARASGLAESTEIEAAPVQVGEIRQIVAAGKVRIDQGSAVSESDRVIFYPLEERAELIGSPSITNGSATVKGLEMELQPGRVVVDGEVTIEQGQQVATSDRVIYYPADERAELLGNAVVTDGEATLMGSDIQLKPGSVFVESLKGQFVTVRLPELPDLGYSGFEVLPSSLLEEDPVEETAVVQKAETVISSRKLRMLSKGAETVFSFTEDVSISGTNLMVNCSELKVTGHTEPGKEATSKNPLVSGQMQLAKIEAKTDVLIEQSGRVAEAELATILPDEGKVILEGNATVTDVRGVVSGHRMTLLKGQQRAIVEGAPGGGRARITLPGLDTGNL